MPVSISQLTTTTTSWSSHSVTRATNHWCQSSFASIYGQSSSWWFHVTQKAKYQYHNYNAKCALAFCCWIQIQNYVEKSHVNNTIASHLTHFQTARKMVTLTVHVNRLSAYILPYFLNNIR